MERDNGCTLIMAVREWRSGMGIGICESRHGRDKRRHGYGGRGSNMGWM